MGTRAMNDVRQQQLRHQLAEIRDQLGHMRPQFELVLPKHVTGEKFGRIVMTAVTTNPDLVACERRSLFNACMRAAVDGLPPDGRLAAIVPFRDKRRGLVATYIPMIAGMRQKARQSGDIATWECHVVRENDEFDYELGDRPHITHKPARRDRGDIIAAYSIAILRTGEVSREVMTVDELEAIRKRSRAETGPWQTDYAEMCRKTVGRRHYKSLPQSAELDELLRREDDDDEELEQSLTPPRHRSLGANLDRLALPDIEAGDEAPEGHQDGEQRGDELSTALAVHDATMATEARTNGFIGLEAAWQNVPDDLKPSLEGAYQRHKAAIS
jgi:recombination protein RecT